jgi:arylsulfatase A-like enzyme
LTTDTLRRDHVSAYADALVPGLTPHIEDLADHSLLFLDAITPAPLTLPAHTSMLTGLLPHEHGATRNGQVIGPDLSAVPRFLASRGYRTGAFVSSSVLHGAHGLSRWFQTYRDDLSAWPGSSLLPFASRVLPTMPANRLVKQPGDRTVEQALGWLGRQSDQDPIFLWVHLYDVHTPHTDHGVTNVGSAWSALPHPCTYADHPARSRRGRKGGFKPAPPPLPSLDDCQRQDWQRLEGRIESYAAEVAFLDQQVSALVEGLERLGRWEDTALILAADHGESLTEQQHHVTHQYSLYDSVTRVPLLLRLPSAWDEPPARVTTPVSTVQVAATLARLGGGQSDSVDLLQSASGMGLSRRISEGPEPGRQRRGRDEPIQGPQMQVAVREGSLKVILGSSDHLERYERDEDPGEMHPLITDAEIDGLRRELATTVDERRPTSSEEAARAQRRARRFTKPWVPAPHTLWSATDSEWIEPPVEDQWFVAGSDQVAVFTELEETASGVLQTQTPRSASEDEESIQLPAQVRESLEVLGYLQ